MCSDELEHETLSLTCCLNCQWNQTIASLYWNEQQNGVLVHQCQDFTHRRSEAARCQNWAKKAVALVSHHLSSIFLFYRETPSNMHVNFLELADFICCYKTGCFFLTKSQRNAILIKDTQCIFLYRVRCQS